jgi:dimethylhistidine N-methyltransferase
MRPTAVPATSSARFSLETRVSRSTSFAEDVARGLAATPKQLPPKWFYDSLGSTLFDAICYLPEYYLTRAEDGLLEANARKIAERCGGGDTRLVELGAGTSRKTRHLMRALLARQSSLEFVPVDVDAGMLESSAEKLMEEFDSLSVRAIAADFTDDALFATPLDGDRHNLVAFLGSTIGNLNRDEAVSLLRNVASGLHPGDHFLLGVDLVKDPAVLEAAYDDPTGVTAAFNLNVLGRINRELGGSFDLRSFEHRAFYNQDADRIEMHLVSRVAQSVSIASTQQVIDFTAGETIHTENSWKYSMPMIERLAAAAEMSIEEVYTDGAFADVLMKRSNG